MMWYKSEHSLESENCMIWNVSIIQFAKNVEDCEKMDRRDEELLKWLVGE